MDKFPSRETRATAAATDARVTAVIVARGLGPDSAGQSPLDLCLRSVLVEPWVDEVIIVDNGNAPEVSSNLRALQADRRDVKIVGAPIGASMAAAANLGAMQAKGRWLLFLGADVVLRRGAVQRMAAAGGEARAPWIVGGRLMDVAGREKPAARPGSLNALSAFALAMEVSAPRRRKGESSVPVGAVSGALMLAPRVDFQNLGGFDVAYVTDYADLDLCKRVADAGGSVWFQPEASGVQFERAEVRGRKPSQGLALFAAKNAKTPLERAAAAMAAPLLPVLIALKDFVVGRPPPPRR